jgi:hypothetical protein
VALLADDRMDVTVGLGGADQVRLAAGAFVVGERPQDLPRVGGDRHRGLSAVEAEQLQELGDDLVGGVPALAR